MGYYLTHLTHLTFLLLWTAPGIGGKPQRHTLITEDQAQFCDEASKHPGAELLKISRTPSTSTYAVMCYTPDCDKVPDSVVVTEANCEMVPEEKKENVVLAHWTVR